MDLFIIKLSSCDDAKAGSDMHHKIFLGLQATNNYVKCTIQWRSQSGA